MSGNKILRISGKMDVRDHDVVLSRVDHIESLVARGVDLFFVYHLRNLRDERYFSLYFPSDPPMYTIDGNYENIRKSIVNVSYSSILMIPIVEGKNGLLEILLADKSVFVPNLNKEVLSLTEEEYFNFRVKNTEEDKSILVSNDEFNRKIEAVIKKLQETSPEVLEKPLYLKDLLYGNL